MANNRTRLPDETVSGDITDGRRPLTLTRSLAIRMEESDGLFFAQHSALLCSGVGDTPEEALAVLRKSFADLWISMAERPESELDAAGRELKRRLLAAAKTRGVMDGR